MFFRCDFGGWNTDPRLINNKTSKQKTEQFLETFTDMCPTTEADMP